MLARPPMTDRDRNEQTPTQANRIEGSSTLLRRQLTRAALGLLVFVPTAFASGAWGQAANIGEATAAVTGNAALPRDLSPLGMFLNADPLVKAVLIGVAFASDVTWTVARQDDRTCVGDAPRAGSLSVACLGAAPDRRRGGAHLHRK